MMPRSIRAFEPDGIYHVLNRGNGRRRIFHKDADFVAFQKVLIEALRRFPVDLLAFCLMHNHWHLLLRPRTKQALSRFVGWLSMTHARRHHAHHKTDGHLYQGRFKSFPVQDDRHFLTVARYIESNAQRAAIVKRAQDWPWSSLGRVQSIGLNLADWPVDRPRDWIALVNEPLAESELSAVRQGLVRGRPFGSEEWMKRIVKRLGLEATLNRRGRPRKPVEQLSSRQVRRRKKEKRT